MSEPENEKKKKTFVFKDYYANNPEFRKKHLAKQHEKITCSCGITVSRSSLCRHQKSHTHLEKIAGGELLFENNKDDKDKHLLQELKEEIEKIKRNIEKIEKGV